MRSLIVPLVSALTLLSSISDVVAFERGLPWATDNRYAPTIGNLPKIQWYHHWADGVVPQMPSKVEYVPMFWGPSQWGSWNTRVSEMNKKLPKHLMAFNEPDISSQSNMNPYYAGQLFMEQIFPWSKKGVLVGSPAIAWNLDWMGTFLGEVSKRGGHVDFICVHWYGSWKDIQQFKNFIGQTHARFGKNIWVTEIGITTASNPSTAQVKAFVMNAFTWMNAQGYVHRASWFGAFESNKAPDGFATGKNALFNPGGSLTDLGYWYGYSSNSKRSVYSRHHLLGRDDENDADPGEPNHCEVVCQLRNAQLASYTGEPFEIEGREPEDIAARDDLVPEDAM